MVDKLVISASNNISINIITSTIMNILDIGVMNVIVNSVKEVLFHIGRVSRS